MHSISETVVTAPIILITCFLLYFHLHLHRVGRRSPDLPPGPPTWPLLGNLPHIPIGGLLHERFFRWAKAYGDIYSLKLGNGTGVVLNSLEAVMEVLEKQSLVTSGRPTCTVGQEVSNGLLFPLHDSTGPGAQFWRLCNRATREVFSPQWCRKYTDVQAAEASQLLFDILETPVGTYTHVNRYVSSTIFATLCGKRAPRFDTPFVRDFHHYAGEHRQLVESGAVLDIVPIFRLIPSFLSPWKRMMAKIKPLQRSLFMSILDDCEKREARGLANGCQFEALRANAKEWGMTSEMIAYLGGVLFEAGSGPVATYIQSLILLMVAYPDVLKRAHTELDSVVGSQRAPTMDDISALPYVQAVVNEVYRFRPATPLNLARRCTTDITYKGYRIPEDSIIWTNYYAIVRDPELFDDPEEFKPERYLRHPLGLGKRAAEAYDALEDRSKSPTKLLETVRFGSGRRPCPGSLYAKGLIETAVPKLLWAFDFGKLKDDAGNDVEPDVDAYEPGAVPTPYPYVFDVRVRSQAHAEIIRKDYVNAAAILEPFEHELSPEELEWVAASRR